jgi:4-amino-4-deoxy-L-arabinose transferase-like glycosyltransferase
MNAQALYRLGRLRVCCVLRCRAGRNAQRARRKDGRRDSHTGRREQESGAMMGEGPDAVRFEAVGTPTETGQQGAPAAPATPAGARTGARGLSLRISWATWLTLAAIAAGVVLRLLPVGGVALDYDEGVYWQSLRAMSQGHPLFTSIFSSQPPLFLLGIYPFYLVFGQSLAAARLGVALYAFLGLAAAYVAGRALGGRVAGMVAVVVLALDPLFLAESHILQAEVPAVAYELASVALAVVAIRQSGSRRRWLAAASGLALALGILTKLFDVVAVVPVVLYLLSPIGPTLVDASGTPRRPARNELATALRVAVPDVLAWAGGVVLGGALVLLPFAGRWQTLYDQVVRYHFAAGAALNYGLRNNITAFFQVSGELPLELAALLAFVLALSRRRWEVLPPALWVGAALVFLLRLHPLLAHDVTSLVPPLALTLAAAVPALSADAAADTRARPGSQLALSGAQGAMAAWALVALVSLWGLGASIVQVGPAMSPPARAAQVAGVLDSVTQPGDRVVSDDQYVAALANRDVPPQLVDTSFVRIQSGYLTAAQLEAAVQATNVRAVLFYSGRFNLVPGFRQWMSDHYVVAATFGDGTTLYVKIPRAPQPA